MILSILIPTVPERSEQFADMQANIESQMRKMPPMWDKVEILHLLTETQKNGGLPTGVKRNQLLQQAKGKYFWFVDDDDLILSNAIQNILIAAETDCDVMAINGLYTENGINPRRWEIALGNPYEATWRDGKEIYLRYPNHITPMKRELVKDILFPSLSVFEDKQWADKVKDAGVLKTQTIIEPPVYHYKYLTTSKKLY